MRINQIYVDAAKMAFVFLCDKLQSHVVIR